MTAPSFGDTGGAQVVTALLQQRDRIPILLTALEKGQIETASIEIAAPHADRAPPKAER